MERNRLNQEWDRLNVKYERLLDKDNLSRRERRQLNGYYNRMREIVTLLES